MVMVMGMVKEVIMKQSVTNIFEYSNIFDTNIYSDIRSYHFLYTNIFGYSFVSKFCYEYIRIFVRIKILIRIYSDIRSFFYEYIRIFLRIPFANDIFP